MKQWSRFRIVLRRIMNPVRTIHTSSASLLGSVSHPAEETGPLIPSKSVWVGFIGAWPRSCIRERSPLPLRHYFIFGEVRRKASRDASAVSGHVE